MLSDYTPASQGRIVRVDLWINESVDPYASWAQQYFVDRSAAAAQPTADPDGDGFTNEQERLAGTDPVDSQNRFRIANFSRAASGDTFSLTWSSTPGKTYQVHTSTQLIGGSWTTVGDPVLATSTLSALTVPSSGVRRYFRVSLVAP
jgi:hypothetical protein